MSRIVCLSSMVWNDDEILNSKVGLLESRHHTEFLYFPNISLMLFIAVCYMGGTMVVSRSLATSKHKATPKANIRRPAVTSTVSDTLASNCPVKLRPRCKSMLESVLWFVLINTKLIIMASPMVEIMNIQNPASLKPICPCQVSGIK